MAITVGVIDKQIIFRKALCSLLERHDDFLPTPLSCSRLPEREELASRLMHDLRLQGYNIVLIHLYDNTDERELALIDSLVKTCPRTRVLVISQSADSKLISKIIKLGAKGFLDANANEQNLVEALFTLRGGNDYFSDVITHILLGQYLGNLNERKEQTEQPGIEKLSDRQIEIIRLWGQNFTNQEIADKLYISVRTVESHKNHIMRALELKTNVDMVKFGIRNNLIQI